MKHIIITLGFVLLASANGYSETSSARTAAFLFEPARAADGERAAMLRKLIMEQFKASKVTVKSMVGIFDPVRFAQAREKLKEGRAIIAKDVSQQRTADAESVLTQALFGLKGSLGHAAKSEVAEVYRGLALTRFVDGDRRLATVYLQNSLLLLPKQSESKFRMNSKFFDLYREVKMAVATAGLGNIKVETTPPGVQIFLGDEGAGFSPITLTNLKEGVHLIRAKRDGYYSHGWLVDVTKGATASVRTRLKPLPGNGKLTAWTKALKAKKTWKKPAAVAEAVKGIRKMYRATDVVVLSVRASKKRVDIVGATAPMGVASRRVQVSLPLDASFLKSVKAFGAGLLK